MPQEKELTPVEWLYNHLFPKQLDGFSDEEWNKIDLAFKQAKELERKKQYKIQFKQKYLDELKLRESLITTSLINPVHLKMTSDGRGEFPDSYHLTEKGIDLLVETLNL